MWYKEEIHSPAHANSRTKNDFMILLSIKLADGHRNLSDYELL